MSQLPFIKLSATGNDFILFDNRTLGLSEADVDFFRSICRRRLSVGANGVLLIDRSDAYDFRLRYFNPDGSETECGNAARAAALFAAQTKLAADTCRFEFGDNVYDAAVSGTTVRLMFPAARGLRENIGVTDEAGLEAAGSINTGVPHFVLFCTDLAGLDVVSLGRRFRTHSHFRPDGTNVDFVEVAGADEIAMRTYERGVEDETLACGTGAVASAIFANRLKGLEFPIKVRAQGGTLAVGHTSAGALYLEGEVELVYRGQLDLKK